MSDHDEAVALARLQAALDRIAAASATAGGEPAPPGEPAPDPRLDEVRSRLDAVIARLRDVLGDG
jgi:hypothetical protein